MERICEISPLAHLPDDRMPNADPFAPEIPEPVLEDLRRRLTTIRWPHVIGEDDWVYGVPQAWLKGMADYWAHEWNWNSTATAMAAFDHYLADMDGIPVHFLHVPGKGPAPKPLILTHGWPWTFWDYKDVIGPLSDPAAFGGDAADAFDVVVPSLPGFGFSTPLTSAGIDVAEVARLWVRLMQDVCGYERFAAHGGDWGALVTAHLGHAHAQSLIGAHLALPLIPGVDRASVPREAYAEDEQWMLERAAQSGPLIRSHVSVHTTDPQTLAYAMSDSPIGTAAWIWERRRNWSDCDGDVERAFDRDHLCTTAALYWCTGAFTSSLRLYFEHFNKPWPLVHDRKPTVEAPTGFAIFPKDVVQMPRRVAAEHTDLRRWSVMPRGGHFGAAEAPDLIVDEIRSFFRDLS
jgi:pimeloyl-ACP methyl ester carboxylesterase